MVNHTTGAQRYNKRMDEIFEKAMANRFGKNWREHGSIYSDLKIARKRH